MKLGAFADLSVYMTPVVPSYHLAKPPRPIFPVYGLSTHPPHLGMAVTLRTSGDTR